MKIIAKYLSRFILTAAIVFGVSCEDMFRNPLDDKETGDRITLLLLDRNFIDTKLLIWFVDAETEEPVEGQYIELQIWGENAGKLITFGGKKPGLFSTEIGFLELACDPNFNVSGEEPLEFTMMAKGESLMSVPQFFSYTQEGTKDIIIRMNKLGPGEPLKLGSFGEPFDISYNGILNSPDVSFITDISNQSTGTAYEYINLYTTLAQGSAVCDNLRDEILYDDYGIYFTSPSTQASIVPPDKPVREASLAAGDFLYSTILRSGIEKCETGLTLLIDRPDGDPGTATFQYVITFSNGETLSGQVSGSFPMEHLIEPIYYPASDPSVSIQLFGDAQYDIASAAVNLSTACGETAMFEADPHTGLRTYKFINQYLCPDNPIGYALSLNGQFRPAETSGPWSSFEFVEGICELELVEGDDYEFRVAMDDEYHYYTLPTDPGRLEQFIQEHQGEDYTIIELTITPAEDKTEVFAILEVSEDVCAGLNGGGDDR